MFVLSYQSTRVSVIQGPERGRIRKAIISKKRVHDSHPIKQLCSAVKVWNKLKIYIIYVKEIEDSEPLFSERQREREEELKKKNTSCGRLVDWYDARINKEKFQAGLTDWVDGKRSRIKMKMKKRKVRRWRAREIERWEVFLLFLKFTICILAYFKTITLYY